MRPRPQHPSLWGDAVKRAAALPVGSASHRRFHKYLAELVTAVREVEPGELMLLPVAWAYLAEEKEKTKPTASNGFFAGGGSQGVAKADLARGVAAATTTDVAVDATGVTVTVQPKEGWASQLLAGSKPSPESRGIGSSEAVMLVLHRHTEMPGCFSIAVCNSGGNEGAAEYHNTVADPECGGTLLRSRSFVLENVSADKLADSSIWYLLFRSAVFPAEKGKTNKAGSTAALLYEQMLPYLSRQPLLANKAGKPRSIPAAADPSRWGAVTEALRWCLVWGAGMSLAEADAGVVAAHGGVCQLANDDLAALVSAHGTLPSEQATLLKYTARQLARQAALEGPSISLPVLAAVTDLVAVLQDEIAAAEPSPYPPTFDLPDDHCIENTTSRFPGFGWFRNDTDVEPLAGPAPVPRIQIPLVLTLMPEHVSSYTDVSVAMRRCAEICALLDAQSDQISNSYVMRLALIQHLFLRVIPMPLTPQKAAKCFWGQQEPIRYETQLEILRLLRVISCDFSAVSLSMQATRSVDAMRMLVMSVIAAIADTLLRQRAHDTPSLLSRHYAGTAEGPVSPFCIEFGAYAEESQNSLFTSPEAAIARTQVLDYFHPQRATPDHHMIFRFDGSMKFEAADSQFIHQLCLASGIDIDTAMHPRLLTGQIPDLLRRYPELEHFRDICFYFKMLLAPTADALPTQQPWRARDAVLSWSSSKDGMLSVSAFGRPLNLAAAGGKSADGGGGILAKMQKLWSGQPRAPPSGSDPSNLVEGFDIKNEDDVLHIRDLPSFDGRLSSSNCELLLQYLTVPYLRVPLMLKFFSDQIRLSSLALPELQEVMDACLFEPGQWHPDDPRTVPDVVPSPTRDFLATPCGLMFHELVVSPTAIVSSLLEMIGYVLEADEGRYAERSASYVCYVIRLLVRVEGFLSCILQHEQWRADGQELSRCGGDTAARGIAASDFGNLPELHAAHERIRAALDGEVLFMLDTWCARSLQKKNVMQCCIILSHMAYTLRNTQTLNQRSVSLLMAAQMFLQGNMNFETGQGLLTDVDIGIPSMEVFEVFQLHRSGILAWMAENPAEKNVAIESVLTVLTMSGNINMPATLNPRNWIHSGGYPGRFRPDTELKAGTLEAETYEQWLRRTTTSSVETEVNMQLGTFTLRKQQMHVLDKWVTTDPNFEDIFAAVKSADILCATVQNQQYRRWVRLVRQRHDIKIWAPDDRKPLSPQDTNFRRRYPRQLRRSEDWIAQVVGSQCPELAAKMILFAQNGNFSSTNMARMRGYVNRTGERVREDELAETEQLREVIVWRQPPVVHVYDIIECGRRHYSTLIFSSDCRLSMHDMDLFVTDSGGEELTRYGGGSIERAPRMVKQSTIVVMRNLSADLGEVKDNLVISYESCNHVPFSLQFFL